MIQFSRFVDKLLNKKPISTSFKIKNTPETQKNDSTECTLPGVKIITLKNTTQLSI